MNEFYNFGSRNTQQLSCSWRGEDQRGDKEYWFLADDGWRKNPLPYFGGESNLKRILFILLTLLWVPLITKAEVIPHSYPTDKHVQVATYDPNQVYRVATMQGYITAIQFGPEEKIISVNIGDSSAWLVNVQNEVINLKPVTDHPDTNMNVLTTRGTYQFFLTAPPPAKQTNGSTLRKAHDNTAFLVRFRYSDSGQPTHLSAQKPVLENWHYTARGDAMTAPVCVYDDGRFTFFDFGARQDIPAIFAVNAKGEESLVNYHMQGKYVVVESTAKQFTLRNGEQVAAVFNEA
jgi:type IV secretion system protein VirB9